MKNSLVNLQRAGFDRSYRIPGGYIVPACSCCLVVAINGVTCHEIGCPNNHPKEEDGDDR